MTLESKKKSIAEKLGFKGRETEEGKRPPFYSRHIKGGGYKLHQVVTPKHVFSLSKNKSELDSPKHGWKLEHKERKETNL